MSAVTEISPTISPGAGRRGSALGRLTLTELKLMGRERSRSGSRLS